EEKERISFWHAISGDNGKVLEDIVNDFNESSNSIEVDAVFQGSYNDLINKIRAMSDHDDLPAIIQSATISRKLINGSDFIEPIQTFIDEFDDFDPSTLEDGVYNYYQID